jgi:hypothetical protein
MLMSVCCLKLKGELAGRNIAGWLRVSSGKMRSHQSGRRELRPLCIGAARSGRGSVELFDGELAGDTITGDGEAAAEAGAELDQKRIVVVLLHGQVDGFAATQGFTSLYGFHHGISLYKLSNCSLCWQMSGQ